MDCYDLIVVGAGPGGYPAAIRAAQQGASVALVEREALGGTCLNWGCIPTKTLIAAGSDFHRLRQGRPGLRAEPPALDYAALRRHKDSVVDTLRGGIGRLLKAHGVALIEGTAAFTTPTRVTVRRDGRAVARAEARRIVIASGSVPVRPSFLPDHPRVVDSRAFLALDRLPDRLIVLGGGVIGCELACLAAQLGATVTIVELLDDILTPLDADVRAEVRRGMERRGIRILTGQPLDRVDPGDAGLRARVARDTLDADLLLVAVGRRPHTEGLDLDKAGLTPSDSGHLDADPDGQTRAAGIYAVGDVTGGPQLAHAATAQGLRAADAALGRRPPRQPAIVPACLFTAPEAAVAGLTETEARAASRAVAVGKFPFAALGKALAEGETAGFVKWIADAATDQLLGAAAVGAHATELIATAVTALEAELTAAEFARTVQAHPTFSEAWLEAAHAVHGRCIHAPPPRRRSQRATP